MVKIELKVILEDKKVRVHQRADKEGMCILFKKGNKVSHQVIINTYVTWYSTDLSLSTFSFSISIFTFLWKRQPMFQEYHKSLWNQFIVDILVFLRKKIFNPTFVQA